ncbi:MAG: TadA family conjugal transfer-associated ATPase [Glaciihabitans sp.]|nr:TadA family conjugal transfer-associated ATPase [Glaciihabitans sp.]
MSPVPGILTQIAPTHIAPTHITAIPNTPIDPVAALPVSFSIYGGWSAAQGGSAPNGSAHEGSAPDGSTPDDSTPVGFAPAIPPAIFPALHPTIVTNPPRATRRILSGDYPAEFGALADLVADARVTDVFVNGGAGTWVDRGTGLELASHIHFDERELRDLAIRLVSLGGRHIDETSPCVDTRLDDGIRVHAVLPPISTVGTLLSVRLPSVETSTLDWLDSESFFTTIGRRVVEQLIAQRENILVTGAGGSGKTTFLAAFLAGAAATERIIAIEDVAELRVNHPHFLSLEARQANLEGAGALGVGRLVREALRMRPDRLVLGECRGPEIRELLSALNTGHDGGGGTLHANSLMDVPARLEALGALAGMTSVAIARQAVSAIGTVLHLERSNGVRRLAQMGRFALDSRDRLIVIPTVEEAGLDSDPSLLRVVSPPPAPTTSPAPIPSAATSRVHAPSGAAIADGCGRHRLSPAEAGR